MLSKAILIGNATYDDENDLPCCAHDVAAMRALLETTGRFDSVQPCVDLDANSMRDLVRSELPSDEAYNEILFYFSGHGTVIAGEFYYCGTNFDGGRPNETGVAHSTLLDLLRSAAPKVLISVIDACYSGTLLIKNDQPAIPVIKEGFRSVLQFSSSREDQTSMGGEPLSAFTRSFLEASIRKTEGTVYYTDIANCLRDNFLENDGQTPFFINQGTGRETFVEDASILTKFRSRLETEWGVLGAPLGNEESSGVSTTAPAPLSLRSLLVVAEKRMTTPEAANAFISRIFDGVLAKFDSAEFAEFFDKAVVQHDYYKEPTVEEFMIRVLDREHRPDRLVTAEIEVVKQKTSPWGAANTALSMALNPQWTEEYTLSLNCTLERAQLSVTLTPTFRALQQVKLVLSCAPSLEHCYLFELVTQHPRTDWEKFSSSGAETVRRWYKLDWTQSVDHLIDKICNGLEKSVRGHVEATTRRLSEGR